MMIPRSILTSFVVLATTLASFSAISPVSADNVAADTTSSFLRQKKSIDEDDKVPLNHDITIGHGHDLDLDREIYHEEDGMIEADEDEFIDLSGDDLFNIPPMHVTPPDGQSKMIEGEEGQVPVKLAYYGWVKLCKHNPCGSGNYVWKRAGWYSSMPWQVGNDALSYVYIPKGMWFMYWQHSSYQGWSRSFGSKHHGINLSMGGHNDAVSSYAIGYL